MIQPILLAALLLFPFSVEAQVYRCDVDGTPTFQGHPCGSSTTKFQGGGLTTYQAPDAHKRPPAPPTRQKSQPRPQASRSNEAPYLERINRRNNITKARARGRLAVGMSETDTISILGYPDNYKSQRFKRDECKQFRWYNPRFSSGHHYALICDGVVEKYSGPSR